MRNKDDAFKLLNDAIAPLNRLADFADAARIGQLLFSILSRARTIIVFHETEIDDWDAQKEEVYRLTAQPVDGNGKTVTANTLLAALEELCDVGESKLCTKCKTWKRLTSFPAHKGRVDGRHAYCRECERARSREYKRRKSKGSFPQQEPM